MKIVEASSKEGTDNQTATFQTVIPELPVNGNTTKHHSEIAPDRKNHRMIMSLIVQSGLVTLANLIDRSFTCMPFHIFKFRAFE